MTVSFTTFLLAFVLASCTLASAQTTGGTIYCAQWGDTSIQGYFAMQLSPSGSPNTAAYAYDINITTPDNFLAACPVVKTTGMRFHLHALWTSSNVTASTLDQCGAGFTGGHYDPNFACASASAWAKTACTALNRTAAQGYTYPCSPSTFATRPGTCEIGDTSGKYGMSASLTLGSGGVRLLPSSTTPTFPYLVNDVLPPYASDFFLGSGTDTNGWSSVVFHCGDAGAARIMCAKLVPVLSWGACSGGVLAGPPTGPASPPPAAPDAGVPIAVPIAASIGSLVVGIVVTYLAMRQSKPKYNVM